MVRSCRTSSTYEKLVICRRHEGVLQHCYGVGVRVDCVAEAQRCDRLVLCCGSSAEAYARWNCNEIQAFT